MSARPLLPGGLALTEGRPQSEGLRCKLTSLGREAGDDEAIGPLAVEVVASMVEGTVFGIVVGQVVAEGEKPLMTCEALHRLRGSCLHQGE